MCNESACAKGAFEVEMIGPVNQEMYNVVK